MTASPPRRRGARVVAASILLTGLSAVSACSAGQITQTSSQVASVPGANASACVDAKTCRVVLRDVLIPYKDPAGYPAGSNAPLVVRLFNQDTAPITLTGVEAPKAAASVALTGGASTGTAAETPEPSASSDPSASPDASASPEPSASAPAPTEQKIAVALPANGYALLVPGQGQYLMLSGLTRKIAPGDIVLVTFSFSDGSKVEVPVTTGPPATAAVRSPIPMDEGHE